MVLQTGQWTASKCINWCSQCMASFHWRSVTLTNLSNNLSFIHNPTKTVEYTAGFISVSPRALHWCCPSISGGPNNDQPRSKQLHLWQKMLLHLYTSLTNLLEFEMIYFTADSVSTNKNWLIYDASHCLMFNPCEQKSRCFAWSATADLSSCEQNF